MKKEPALSIVIPVYRTDPEQFSECLQSVCSQSFEDYEVLIVSDGASEELCRMASDYESKDSRFHLIRQENRGVCTARNRGIEEASGKWLCFIDSDDRIERDYLSDMVSSIKDTDVDILCTGHTKLIGSRRFEHDITGHAHSMNTDTVGTVWGKLYRRDFVGGRRFDPRLSRAEDIEFNLRVFKDAGIQISSSTGYLYRFVTGSAVHNFDGRSIEKYLDTLNVINSNSSSMNEEQLRVSRGISATIFRVIVENYVLELPVSLSKKRGMILELMDLEPFKKAFAKLDYGEFTLTRKVPLWFAARRMPLCLMAVIRIKQKLRGEER